MLDEPLRLSGLLIVRADGTMRAVKRATRLRFDEVAFPIRITIPSTWGRVQDSAIDIELPEPPRAFVVVGDPDDAAAEARSG